MKILRFSFVFLGALALIAPLSAAAATNIDTLLHQSAVTLQTPVQTPDGLRYAMDGGTIVGKDGSGLLVLTAAHSVEVKPHPGGATSADTAKPGIQVWTYDRSAALNVLSVRFVPGHDEAILHTSMPFGTFNAATLATAPPTLGESLTVIGSPYGKAFTVSPATAISPTLLPSGATGTVAIMCKDCYEGDSGGGVFDANGDLVGVLTAAWSNKANQVIAIEVEPYAPALAMLASR